MTKHAYEDLTGMRFGRLIAIKYVGKSRWLCKCDCGGTKVTRASSLKSGYTKSCGCIGGHTTHGLSHTRLYQTWCNMKSRCYREGSTHYAHYGGRGIKMCDEWKNDFKAFYDWAMANGYDPKARGHELTIDRIDVDGDYTPDNCRWTDASTQCRNRRRYKNPKENVPVDLIDADGNVIRSYGSITEASEDTGCRKTSIWGVCNGQYKTSLGLRWQYSNKYLLKSKD